ncbi:MurR/RpiR family transcriptional regulator [Streptococcus uberis]|uniref:MurR/RpiR family transcriptional regulator n=1 Tax=Streptococcus uberis TaxID=1349 RepID=UPI00193B3E65|nr:MurR/RpiR family transcriptional regulator [Streptococcus uberis]
MENRRLSLLYTLQNLYNSAHPGSIEYLLSSYLIDNYHEIDKLNIYDLAEENNVSRATVRRFCKNLGYENFKELKSHFNEFDEGLNIYKEFYNSEHFLEILQTQIKKMFSELEDRLNSRELLNIVRKIKDSDEVIIIASSTIANSVRVFQQTMALLGKRITIIVSKQQIIELEKNISSDSLILIFSISGVLAETFQDCLKNYHSDSYLFTNNRNPLFNQNFTRVYHLTSMENKNKNEIIYYTYGITYILDSIINRYCQLI